MKNYYIICNQNGEILSAFEFSEFQNADGMEAYYQSIGQVVVEVQEDQYPTLKQATVDDTHYYDGSEFVVIAPSPSAYHYFDFVTKQWVLPDGYLEAAKDKKRKEVNDMRSLLLSAPVEYQGSQYDADSTAIQNISSVLLLGGDESVIWRDYNNQDHTMTMADLQGLANAIKDRNSLLYARSWEIKADIDALIDIDTVNAYVITFG